MKTTALTLILIPVLLIAPLLIVYIPCMKAATETPQIQWSKTYSTNLGFSLDQTSDDGYIIAGVNRTGFHDSLSFSTMVIKTNALGELTWIKQFGDKFSGPLFPIYIIKTSDLGYILSTPINKLIKLDSEGNIEWNSQVTSGKAVEVNDGYVVAGFSVDSFGTHFSNITKVDFYGKILWIKTFDNGFHGNIAFRALSKTIDGKYAVVGNWGSSFWFGILDSNGNLMVNKTYPSYGVSNIFSGIANTNDSGFILCGQNGNANAVLYKVDAEGNLEWNNTYSPSAFNSVVQLSNNEFLAGTNQGFTVWANSSGYQKGVANYSGGIYDIVNTLDGGFAATGSSNDKLWLAKFTLEGNSSPTPTNTPYQEPQPDQTEIVIIVAIVVAIIIAGLGFLIYLIKRK